MDQNTVAKIIVCSSALASSYLYLLELDEQSKKPRNRKTWVRSWLKNRLDSGAYHAILNELKLHDFESFRRYLRMNTDTFEVGEY